MSLSHEIIQILERNPIGLTPTIIAKKAGYKSSGSIHGTIKRLCQDGNIARMGNGKSVTYRFISQMTDEQLESKKIMCLTCGSSFTPASKNNAFCKRLCSDNYQSSLKAVKYPEIISLDNEVWEWISGYEDLYQVSSMGRFKSFHSGRMNPLLNTMNKLHYESVNHYG